MKSILTVAILFASSVSAYGQCGPSGCFSQPCPPQYTIRRPIISPIVQQQTTVSTVTQIGLAQIVSSMRDGNDTIRRYGSGTVLFATSKPSWRAYILTCSHILGPDWEIEVRATEGWTLPGKVLITDGPSDLALIVVEGVPAGAKYIPLDTETTYGATVTYNGWSSRGYHRLGGRLLRGIGRIVVGAGRVLEGMSGGPFLSQRGVVAIITEAEVDAEQVQGPSAISIRQWIVASGYGFIVGEAVKPIPPTPKPVGNEEMPLPVPGSQPPATQVVVDLKLVAVVELHTKQLADHETRIKTLEGKEPASGLPGPAGPTGPPGPAGPKGETGLVRIDLLDGDGDLYESLFPVDGVISLPATRLQTFDADGKFRSETTAPLGEPLGLKARFFSAKGE